MLSNRGHLRLAFETLHEDLLHILRFVEPCIDNEGTYSHEIWSLYVRTCMELETVFKQVAIVRGHKTLAAKKQPTILDYRALESELGLEHRTV